MNFLSSIIEVARRGYENGGKATELDKLPMGIAQERTIQLLIDNVISTDDAYALDEQGVHYDSTKTLSIPGSPQKTSPKEQHKSPFGAATGKDLENNHQEVRNKINRINEKYNERYDTNSTMVLIEGRNLMRQCLGEEYGSDGESSGEDYSTDDGSNQIPKIPDLQFFKPEKNHCGYELKNQNPSFKFVTFAAYKSHQFTYPVLNGAFINSFLASIGLRRGKATTDDNNCLLDSYFQNIQGFFKSNYPSFVLADQDLPDFVTFIRKKINKIHDEMLSVNDENEGVNIIKAVQEYLNAKFQPTFGFSVEILFADRDGKVAVVDNLSQIQNAIPTGQITIPLHVIQVGSNHYEPIFVNVLPENTQPMTAPNNMG